MANMEDKVLCGDCSDDMGIFFDEWPDALQDIPEKDRIPCAQCGQ